MNTIVRSVWRMTRRGLLTGAASLVLAGCAGIDGTGTADPLPSWNDGANKQAILKFVADVLREGAATFVAPAERIAVFDNDGTLWAEQPLYFADQKPADAPQGNWLPTPKGMGYSLTFRFYRPQGAVAQRSYFPPALVRR